MSDIKERLRDPDLPVDDAWLARLESADLLEAQEKEIDRLKRIRWDQKVSLDKELMKTEAGIQAQERIWYLEREFNGSQARQKQAAKDMRERAAGATICVMPEKACSEEFLGGWHAAQLAAESAIRKLEV